MYYYLVKKEKYSAYVESVQPVPETKTCIPMTKQEYDAAIAALRNDDEPETADI